MFIDTHAHLNFKAFEQNYRDVIKRTLDNDCWLINVGSQYETSKRAVQIAQEFDRGVFASVGQHPCHSEEHKFDYEKFKALAQDPKVVAIGETGLDHYRLPKGQEEEILQNQKELFRQQISLAKELGKPLIVHCRDNQDKPGETYNRLYQVLKSELVGKNYHSRPSRFGEDDNHRLPLKQHGTIHCYLGTIEMAQKLMDLGFYISFTGVITFKNAPEAQAVAKSIPLDRLLLDTDCPYLAPEPHRGEQNEPLYAQFIAQKHAELRGITAEEVIEKTTENAKKLFRI